MKIRVEKLVYGGAGIARTEEGVVFVSKVLPGEVVEVEIVDRKKDYANARLVEVIEVADGRGHTLKVNSQRTARTQAQLGVVGAAARPGQVILLV